MIERTISRDEWVSFCEGFSAQHEGWLVHIEAQDAAGAVRTIARDEPLAAVEIEPDAERISVRVGRAGAERLVEIPVPAAIHFRETRSGEHQGLRIESADGRSVDLSFRSAARPEMLDGFVRPR